MKTAITAFALLALTTVSAFAGECDYRALEYAKAIQSIDMPKQTATAKFNIVSAIEDELETVYTIEMLDLGADGKYSKNFTDQQYVLVNGSCQLFSYSLPNAS